MDLESTEEGDRPLDRETTERPVQEMMLQQINFKRRINYKGYQVRTTRATRSVCRATCMLVTWLACMDCF